MSKKNSIKEIKPEPEISSNLKSANVSQGKQKYYQGPSSQPGIEEMVNPGILTNRANYSIPIKYGNNTIMVAPRSRPVIANIDLLGSLPKFITLIPKN